MRSSLTSVLLLFEVARFPLQASNRTTSTLQFEFSILNPSPLDAQDARQPVPFNIRLSNPLAPIEISCPLYGYSSCDTNNRTPHPRCQVRPSGNLTILATWQFAP